MRGQSYISRKLIIYKRYHVKYITTIYDLLTCIQKKKQPPSSTSISRPSRHVSKQVVTNQEHGFYASFVTWYSNRNVMRNNVKLTIIPVRLINNLLPMTYFESHLAATSMFNLPDLATAKVQVRWPGDLGVLYKVTLRPEGGTHLEHQCPINNERSS